MKCPISNEDLSEYFDKEAPLQRIELLEKHLESCPDCQKILSNFEEVRRLLKLLAQESLEPDKREKLESDLRNRITRLKSRGKFKLKKRAMLLLAASLGFLFIFLISIPAFNLWKDYFGQVAPSEKKLQTEDKTFVPEERESLPLSPMEKEAAPSGESRALPEQPVIQISNRIIDPDKPFYPYRNERTSSKFAGKYGLYQVSDFQDKIIKNMNDQLLKTKEDRDKFNLCLKAAEDILSRPWLPVLADKVQYKESPAWTFIFITGEEEIKGEFDSRYLFIVRIRDFEVVAEAKDEISR